MSEPLKSDFLSVRTIGRFMLGFLGLAFFYFLMIAGHAGFVEIGTRCLFGWAWFIAETWPRISWDPVTVISGIIFTGLLAFIAHHFLVWLTSGIASARGSSFQWRWRWTYCALILTGLSFLIGMAVTGAVHQFGWIMTSPEPLYENRGRKYIEIAHADDPLREALLETNTFTGLRERVSALQNEQGFLKTSVDSLHVLVHLSPSNTVERVLVFPRDTAARKGMGGRLFAMPDFGVERTIPAPQLQEFIRTNETKWITF